MAIHSPLPMIEASAPQGSSTQQLSHKEIPHGRPIDAASLTRLCREAGADDVGFVSIARPELDGDRADILNAFPPAKTLIGFVVRMNREPIRSPARSIANLEFHRTGDRVDAVAHAIVQALEAQGVRALNPAMGFPMEMDRFPGKLWTVSHKKVAEAAGLGRMGLHRNIIHPKFGSFILLGTVLMDAEVQIDSPPLDFNPCLTCKLCVAVCPTGAIASDGYFDFSACYTHNYREFMGGFSDWVETLANSRSAREYRNTVTDSETVSLWQSLSYGANYKAAYCLAVCPAGEDVLPPFQTDRRRFTADIVKPLQHKAETVYVVPGSDAERHLAQRFPMKVAKRVGNGLRVSTVQGFLQGLPLVFQRHPSRGLDATYHLTFVGEEPAQATVHITHRTVRVLDGLHGRPDVQMTADSRTWLDGLYGTRSLLWAVLRGKLRVRGPLRLLKAFQRCFPR